MIRNRRWNPPLHPNCDCVVAPLELSPGQYYYLRELLERYKRAVGQVRLLLNDRDLPERDREELDLVRAYVHRLFAVLSLHTQVPEAHLRRLEDVLAETARTASKVKYRLSLNEANESVKPGERAKAGEGYSDKALYKAEELDALFRVAAEEFQASLRVVKAAFASEFERREKWVGVYGIKDDLLDAVRNVTKYLPEINDFGLANIDYLTALRLRKRFNIAIPEGMKLVDYLVTEDGTIRFASAAIREAQDELAEFIRKLPGEKRKVMESLNYEEMDGLLVAIYKRGPDEVKSRLDAQLDGLLVKRNKQKYVHLMEGYKAWWYWLP